MDEDDGVDNSHIDLAKKIEELSAWGDTKECLDKIAETDTKNLHELLKKGEKTPEGFEDMIREILMALGQQASTRKTPAELVAVLVDIDRKRFEELIAKEKAKREECQQEYTNAKAANIETGLAVDNFVASVKNRKELLEEIAASIANLQQKMSLNATCHHLCARSLRQNLRAWQARIVDELSAMGNHGDEPSGKLTVRYWKLPFIVDIPIKSGGFP